MLYSVFMGQVRCISGDTAARKSITIATHIMQIASRKKLSTTIEVSVDLFAKFSFTVLYLCPIAVKFKADRRDSCARNSHCQ